MPGRSCTGNPNHTGTACMPCHNTWLLCLPANFQQRHKVEREKRRRRRRRRRRRKRRRRRRRGRRKAFGGKVGREREEAKGEKNTLFLLVALPSFLHVFSRIVVKSQAEKLSLLYPKSCQKCSFQLSRQSRLSQNNIGFFCDKENIAMVMQKKKKSRLGGWKSQGVGKCKETFIHVIIMFWGRHRAACSTVSVRFAFGFFCFVLVFFSSSMSDSAHPSCPELVTPRYIFNAPRWDSYGCFSSIRSFHRLLSAAQRVARTNPNEVRRTPWQQHPL